MPEYWPLLMAGLLFFAVLGIITAASQMQNLDGIKSKTVGDGQHGTARWATRAEIRRTYVRCHSPRKSGANRPHRAHSPPMRRTMHCPRGSWSAAKEIQPHSLIRGMFTC